MKIYLHFYRKPNAVQLELLLKIWFIPLRLNFSNKHHPLTKLFWVLSKNRFWQQKPPADLRATDVAWPRVFARLFLLQQISFTVFRETINTLHKIARPIKIKKISLYTEASLSNTAQTALAVGSFWWIWGVIYSQLGRYFNLTETENKIAIIPNYQQQNLLLIDFSCILEFPLGHIMIIMYYLLINFRKIRNLLRRISQ